ncbi:MAG: aminotransferase class I/II-fold pyridoxal phosphate-dependent enzyme [Deltaproteobacteria bacterium]|nr:aminotransferase class I/II-fold pyridoxal phosphate-dependent enzyme [Deltaproteobacteria bacterium]
MKKRAFGGFAAFNTLPNTPTSDLELSPIKAVELRAARIPDVVSLAQGIPSFDTPEPIKRFVIQKIAEGACSKYSLTPGLPQLRELISEALLAEGMRYDPDGEIIVTCGSIEAISATLLASVSAGDEVLVASPTYASYIPAIRLTGATPRFVPLNEDANFDLDPDAIAKAIGRNTAAILLSNPNNPTGTIYSEGEMRRMMQLAARHDLLVITDEVYKDFLYTNEAAGNPAKMSEYRDRVVRVCSFSKAYGMTGWRVGFLHTTRQRADEILKIHDALVTCAPVVSQYAAIAALEVGGPFVEQFRNEFRLRRARIIERLDALPEIFDYQKPNASYFAFPRIKDTVPLARDSRALANDILDRARVALVPGVAFGPTGESHLRFCYAREQADIDRAFDRLTDYFNGSTPRSYSLPAEGVAATRPRRERWTRRLGVLALHSFARIFLARRRPRIVAIAGGRGKTVLKRTLSEMLASSFRVRSNPLSYNTDVGIAFAILDTTFDTRKMSSVAAGLVRAAWRAIVPDPVDVLVLELGVRRAGDMQRLLQVVRPDIAVITTLAPSYSEDQEGLSTMRAEMKVLIDSMTAHGGSIAACIDDLVLADLATAPLAHRFGRGDMVERDGQRALRIEGRKYDVHREVVGESSVYALAATVIVAQKLGISDEAIQRFLMEETTGS